MNSFNVFNGHKFLYQVNSELKSYYDVKNEGLKLFLDVDFLTSSYGGYYKEKNMVRIVQPLFYTKQNLIHYSAVVYHEFTHYLRHKFPEKLGDYLSSQIVSFDKDMKNGRGDRITYQYTPIELEGWFAGYAFKYFMHKKTKFKYASKAFKNLSSKSDQEIIDVLKKIAREKD